MHSIIDSWLRIQLHFQHYSSIHSIIHRLTYSFNVQCMNTEHKFSISFFIIVKYSLNYWKHHNNNGEMEKEKKKNRKKCWSLNLNGCYILFRWWNTSSIQRFIFDWVIRIMTLFRFRSISITWWFVWILSCVYVCFNWMMIERFEYRLLPSGERRTMNQHRIWKIGEKKKKKSYINMCQRTKNCKY